MSTSRFGRRLPGYLATGMLALTTTLWTFWSFGEVYYEGWWGAWTNRLPYLVPCAACVALTCLALAWPRAGGWTILALGGAFTAWRWLRQAQLGMLTWQWLLGWFPVSGILLLVGTLFLLEGRHRRRQRAEGWIPAAGWLRRTLRYLVALAPPLLMAIGVTLYFLPLLASRYDSGDRGVQRIEAGSVSLVWAPAGPGWNWRPWGPEGRWLSWDDLALYGTVPVGIGPEPKVEDLGRHGTAAEMATTGLCRYLSPDGTELMAEPPDIWRLPTADEVVASLVRQGQPAGCTWDGTSSEADCVQQPNKDTPLWAPDEAPIYYWTADEYDAGSAWYVPYTGGLRYGGAISYQPKDWGNSRHGFRCVREPAD
jgi:hypothetical protein